METLPTTFYPKPQIKPNNKLALQTNALLNPCPFPRNPNRNNLWPNPRHPHKPHLNLRHSPSLKQSSNHKPTPNISSLNGNNSHLPRFHPINFPRRPNRRHFSLKPPRTFIPPKRPRTPSLEINPNRRSNLHHIPNNNHPHIHLSCPKNLSTPRAHDGNPPNLDSNFPNHDRKKIQTKSNNNLPPSRIPRPRNPKLERKPTSPPSPNGTLRNVKPNTLHPTKNNHPKTKNRKIKPQQKRANQTNHINNPHLPNLFPSSRTRFFPSRNHYFRNFRQNNKRTIPNPLRLNQHPSHGNLFFNTNPLPKIPNRRSLRNQSNHKSNSPKPSINSSNNSNLINSSNLHSSLNLQINSQKHPQNSLHKNLNNNPNFPNNNNLPSLRISRHLNPNNFNNPRPNLHRIFHQEKLPHGRNPNPNNHLLPSILTPMKPWFFTPLVKQVIINQISIRFTLSKFGHLEIFNFQFLVKS